MTFDVFEDFEPISYDFKHNKKLQIFIDSYFLRQTNEYLHWNIKNFPKNINIGPKIQLFLFNWYFPVYTTIKQHYLKQEFGVSNITSNFTFHKNSKM